MRWSTSVAYSERLPMSNAIASGKAKSFHIQEHTTDIQTHAALIPQLLSSRATICSSFLCYVVHILRTGQQLSGVILSNTGLV